MQPWISLAGVFGALGVGVGAFAAHALEGMGDERAFQWVEKAGHYMLWHALALAVVAVVADRLPERRAPKVAGVFFTLGIVLFCGSLLTLAFTGWQPIAMAAPFGGTSFMVGWLALAWVGLRRRG